MRINIELDTENRADLAALAALIMSLRGDTLEDIGSPIPAAAPAPPAPPAPPAANIPPPPADNAPPISESLIEAEAQRAAGAGAPAELDKTGLPYDARIHSSTKAVNNDGTWRNKRGVDAALLQSVTTELRARTAAPVPAADEQPPAQTPEAAFSPPDGAANAPPAPPPGEQQPPAPPAPPAESPPPPPAGDGSITYPAIIKAANDKGLSYDQLNQTAVTLGLTAFKDLVKRPDLFESFMASIG